MSLSVARREFLKLAGAAAIAQRIPAADKPVRVGMVGVGNRGTAHVKNLLDLPGVEIPAICDINEANLSKSQALVEKAGHTRPEGYSSGLEDFRR